MQVNNSSDPLPLSPKKSYIPTGDKSVPTIWDVDGDGWVDSEDIDSIIKNELKNYNINTNKIREELDTCIGASWDDAVDSIKEFVSNIKSKSKKFVEQNQQSHRLSYNEFKFGQAGKEWIEYEHVMNIIEKFVPNDSKKQEKIFLKVEAESGLVGSPWTKESFDDIVEIIRKTLS